MEHNCWVETTQIASNIGTLIGLIYAFYAWNTARKQLHFSALDRCVSMFREKFMKLDQQSSTQEIEEYIDFVNEELFYFQEGYLPENVAIEWIEGMLNYLPVYSPKSEVLNSSNATLIGQIRDNDLLKQHPRVKKAFTVKKSYDFEKLYSEPDSDIRKLLAMEIYQNLKKEKSWKGQLFRFF